MIEPTVNPKGTAPEVLLRQQQSVIDAARALADALREAMPQEEDYPDDRYHLDPKERLGYVACTDQWHRIHAAQEIQKDAVAILLSVQAQTYASP